MTRVTHPAGSGWIARLRRVRPFVGAGAEQDICGSVWAVSASSNVGTIGSSTGKEKAPNKKSRIKCCYPNKVLLTDV